MPNYSKTIHMKREGSCKKEVVIQQFVASHKLTADVLNVDVTADFSIVEMEFISGYNLEQILDCLRSDGRSNEEIITIMEHIIDLSGYKLKKLYELIINWNVALSQIIVTDDNDFMFVGFSDCEKVSRQHDPHYNPDDCVAVALSMLKLEVQDQLAIEDVNVDIDNVSDILKKVTTLLSMKAANYISFDGSSKMEVEEVKLVAEEVEPVVQEPIVEEVEPVVEESVVDIVQEPVADIVQEPIVEEPVVDIVQDNQSINKVIKLSANSSEFNDISNFESVYHPTIEAIDIAEPKIKNEIESKVESINDNTTNNIVWNSNEIDFSSYKDNQNYLDVSKVETIEVVEPNDFSHFSISNLIGVEENNQPIVLNDDEISSLIDIINDQVDQIILLEESEEETDFKILNDDEISSLINTITDQVDQIILSEHNDNDDESEYDEEFEEDIVEKEEKIDISPEETNFKVLNDEEVSSLINVINSQVEQIISMEENSHNEDSEDDEDIPDLIDTHTNEIVLDNLVFGELDVQEQSDDEESKSINNKSENNDELISIEDNIVNIPLENMDNKPKGNWLTKLLWG